jgi:hypothetical protein
MSIISKNEGGAYGIIANHLGDGRLQTYFEINGYKNVGVSTSTLSAGVWYYVVGVYNGTAVDFYLNGEKKESVAASGSISNIDQHLLVGENPPGDGELFGGEIDEVRIYSRALSPQEIKQQYTSNLNKFDQSSWQFSTLQSNLSQGTYTYSAYAKDSAGNENATEARTYTYSLATCGISANDINFDIVDPGEISSEQIIDVNNLGNTPTTSLTVKGTDWNSGIESFTAEQTHYASISGMVYTSMNVVTNSETDVGKQASPGSPLPIYLKLKIPEGQNQGGYAQTITFTGGC